MVWSRSAAARSERNLPVRKASACSQIAPDPKPYLSRSFDFRTLPVAGCGIPARVASTPATRKARRVGVRSGGEFAFACGDQVADPHGIYPPPANPGRGRRLQPGVPGAGGRLFAEAVAWSASCIGSRRLVPDVVDHAVNRLALRSAARNRPLRAFLDVEHKGDRNPCPLGQSACGGWRRRRPDRAPALPVSGLAEPPAARL
jgi:hypothetical protein